MVGSDWKTRTRTLSIAFSVVGILLVVAALALLSHNLLMSGQAGADAADVLLRVEQQMPDERRVFSGQASGERMAMVQVDGHSYVGILEFSRFDVRLPVLAEHEEGLDELAPRVYGGSATDGTLVIAGNNSQSQFGDLNRFNEGDAVVFTDVSGQEFHYRVTTFESFDNDEMGLISAGSDNWDLTLFSASFSGQSQVVVRLVLK